jgi:hypothetical protein
MIGLKRHTWCPYYFPPNQNSSQSAFEVAKHLSKPFAFKSICVNIEIELFNDKTKKEFCKN